ncbi:MAG: hypothetical protein IT423_06200 [Pirellulaceae bacterium]|nr:hypothetical protein [Pirellulaceae bacterium]
MELLRKLLNIAATSLVTIAWSSSAMFVAAQNTSPLTTADAPQSNSTTEDRILYGPALPRSTNVWNSPQTITLTGTIETLDQQAIVFVDTLGERRKLPSDRIEAIEVNWETPSAKEAHARFALRDYVAVLKENDEVLRAGGFAKWQQVILLSELVQSCEALGKIETAGSSFLILSKLSPPDYLVATIPLNWTSREATPQLTKVASMWLEQPDEYAGLLGASWLLLGESSEPARQRLLKLQTSSHKTVARLAAVQLWRTVPPSETTGRMQKWFEARDSLSLPMQLGPTEFLAERMARISRPALAVGEWLRIGAMQPQHAHRAASALEEVRLRLDRTKTNESQPVGERVARWRDELNQPPVNP